jgi:hypothetical protein
MSDRWRCVEMGCMIAVMLLTAAAAAYILLEESGA